MESVENIEEQKNQFNSMFTIFLVMLTGLLLIGSASSYFDKNNTLHQIELKKEADHKAKIILDQKVKEVLSKK